MKVRYSYLPQQFSDCDDLWKDLKNFVSTGDFTLGKPLNIFEENFAKWNGNPDLASYQALIRGNAPARKSITDLMVAEKPIIAGAIAANLPDNMGVKWIDTGPSWMALEKETWKFIQYALVGEKTPEQALKDAKVDMEKILKRDRFYEEIAPLLLGN